MRNSDFAEAKGDVTLCKWAKTRDMRPMDFAFIVLEGLPVEAEYMPIEAKRINYNRLYQVSCLNIRQL